jgi:uncharacterized membrane protein
MSLWATIAGLVAFPLLDFLWLGVLMKTFYRDGLREVARMAPDGSMAVQWSAAVPVYFVLVLGLAAFVLPRAGDGSLAATARWGALFGLVTYGVYDLTNLATLRGYSVTLALVDMAWGAVVCGSVAAIMQAVTRAGR